MPPPGELPRNPEDLITQPQMDVNIIVPSWNVPKILDDDEVSN
jgi:hypothetical protein